MFPSKFYP